MEIKLKIVWFTCFKILTYRLSGNYCSDNETNLSYEKDVGVFIQYV